MRKRIIIIISFVFTLTLLGTIGFFIYKELELTSVYVSSHNLSQRSVISQEDIREVKLPKIYISETMITNKKDIIGKYVKLSHAIPTGSYIYVGALEDKIADYTHTLLKNNEVSYDLYTNEIKINPGSLGINMNLDLYLTINNQKNVVSDLLLSNVRIIGFFDQNGKQIQDYDKQSRVAIVTVALNKEDVSILNKALVLGDLRAVVSDSTYKDLDCVLNNDSKLIEYLS